MPISAFESNLFVIDLIKKQTRLNSIFALVVAKSCGEYKV